MWYLVSIKLTHKIVRIIRQLTIGYKGIKKYSIREKTFTKWT